MPVRESVSLIAGRYQAELPLGRGGAAQVLRVRDVSTGARLALKLLHHDAGAKVAALFELEYRTLASIRHPCVVRALEFGRDERGGSFYTMELLEGEDLKERAPVSWREACAHVRDAARALALLHARGVVHRDVSPRNLFRGPDGRVKLIDFGSLAPFGRSDHVVGTPPFLAPEALYGQDLDQRTDLYALGAVAYYLLTRAHAFPATDLRDLPEYWRSPPCPPSVRVEELGRADLEPVPAALDALVLALLSPSMLARPSSGAEVIDRIDALTGREADDGRAQRELVTAYLASTAYVGRTRAQRTLRRQLALAHQGRGQCTVIEGEPGIGRSRCLQELAIAARVTESAVLHAPATGGERPYELASTLASQLLRVLPNASRAAASSYAVALASLSPTLAAELGRGSVTSLEHGAEQRMRVQRALSDWFLAVAGAHTLVVLVDDFDRADEGSQAFLLALAEARAGHRLLLACTTHRAPTEASAPERALRASARALKLAPLTLADTHALLHSIYGDAENLERLSARVQRASHGVPGHAMELCAQLLASDEIRYVDGSWVLPKELPGALMAASREQMLVQRQAGLGPAPRALAQQLSVHAGAMPLELAQALADSASAELFGALPALLDAGVCALADGKLHFVHESVRRSLRETLQPERALRAHRVVGAFLMERASTALERLQAGAHLIESGDVGAEGIVAQAALHIVLHDPDESKPAAPAAERALALLRGKGRPEREQLPLLGLLSMAGYTGDLRYALQYGRTTVAIAREVAGLGIADRLRPLLGPKGSLIAGIAVGAAKLSVRRRDPRIIQPADARSLLFAIVASLCATSVVILDANGARAYAEALAPFAALGEKHIAAFMYDYCVGVSELVRDRHAHTKLRWQGLLARLEDPALTRDVSESLKKRLMYGALSSLGVIEAQRDGDAALALADRAEQAGLFLTQMTAGQIRAVHYANQGNLALFERHRARAEQLAIQQGTSWQSETWAASTRSTVGFRTHDVLMLQQVALHVERMTADAPSLKRLACRARGAYLARRGRHAEAVAWLEDAISGAPREYVGWARTHGILAHTLNALGQHRRALEACMRVFEHSTEEDLAFGGAELIVHTERLIAEAALGDAAGAHARLCALLRSQEDLAGPLTLSELHDAGITIARACHDDEAAERHLDELQRVALVTSVPSLVQHAAARQRELEGHARPPGTIDLPGALITDTSGSRMLDTVERALAGGTLTLSERAHRALQILAQETQTRRGRLYLFDTAGEPREMAWLGDDVLPEEVRMWIRGVGEPDGLDDATQLIELSPGGEREGETLALGGRYFRLVMLTHLRPIGCAVLISDTVVPPSCPGDVLRAIAQQLSRSRELPIHPSQQA